MGIQPVSEVHLTNIIDDFHKNCRAPRVIDFANCGLQRYSQIDLTLRVQEKTLKTKNTSSGLPVVLGAASLAAYYFFARPQLLKWGTQLGESQRRLPGDEIIPKPNVQSTYAINIDAPPEAVWPWLAQMGRERTGYYGLDLLTNAGLSSVTFVRQDLPAPAIGMEMDGGFHIMALEPQRQFLFGGFNLQQEFGIIRDITILYLLERRRDGSTRLLTRHRAFSYGLLGALYNLVYEGLYFAAAIQQFQFLKQHAESMAHLNS
jgi:hypothetical protein